MENQDINNELQSVTLDNESINELLETRKWSMFLSVCGFVFLGLGIIFAFVMLVQKSAYMPRFSGIMLLPMIILTVVYFFPIYYLYKFSVISKEVLTVKSNYKPKDAFEYLKRHYRFMGILCIVIFSIYLLAFLAFGVSSLLI